MIGFWAMGKWERVFPIAAMMVAVFVCSVCFAQVTAADFNAGQTLTAKDFLGLAENWEAKADQVWVKYPTSDSDLAAMSAKSATLRECATDLRKLVDKKTGKSGLHPRYRDPLRNLPSWEWQMIEEGATSEQIEAEWDRRYGKSDLFVNQQDVAPPAEAFGQVPPRVVKPQPLPNVPDTGPGGPMPTTPHQVPNKHVQAPTQAPTACVASPMYAQPQRQIQASYGSGGRWRLFGGRRGGFRGRRGGC